jgi:glyoxylase-like metal-dependent hydrolase (beta-lactamase superfamily II)
MSMHTPEHSLERRRFCMCMGMAGLFTAISPAAHAAAPMLKSQAPGYYRMMLGQFEITALLDGTSLLPAEKMVVAPFAQTQAELQREFLTATPELSVNTYLVNTGAKLILIDTGAGDLLGPTLGRLAASLLASGYKPEQVDEIYLTHMHPDHCGGLTYGGKARFANAIVHAHRDEAGVWLSQEKRDAAPKDEQRRYRLAMASLAPYVASGRFETFGDGDSLAPGIQAIAAEGHTPGHTTFRVESQGQVLVFWGDLLVVGAIQFAHPEVATRFDGDGAEAAVARRKAFSQAAAQGYWVAGAHLSFPGLGHVRGDGGDYAFVPVNYSSLTTG